MNTCAIRDESQVCTVLSSWGSIRIVNDRDGVVECSLPHLTDVPRDSFGVLESVTDPFSRYVKELLEGGNPERPLVGKLRGTIFQQNVWNAMLTIPHGETRSYKELAEMLGNNSACRAVANACGRNPVPLFIPCHRVICSDGNPGGFSCGIAWKRLLLAIEQRNYN